MASWAPNVTPDWKQPKRHVATKTEWEKIRAHFRFHPCVHCGLAHQHLHHVAFKSEGGGDVIENLCPICTTHHQAFHSRSNGWRGVAASIRKFVLDDPHRRQYAENALGHRFEQRYPPLGRVCPKLDCLLPDGHHGAHADLADECFQPKHTDDYVTPERWEASI